MRNWSPGEGRRCRIDVRAWLLLACALVFLAACSRDPGTGPVDVKWDRDACARCRMVVSDRVFAAEVRSGPKRQVYKFDDLGCAIVWLEDQPWKDDPATEIWVADFRTGQWLDARKAYYVSVKNTPMDYGLGATADAAPGSVDFEGAKAKVFAKEEEWRQKAQTLREQLPAQ